jgi:hypothetical protein
MAQGENGTKRRAGYLEEASGSEVVTAAVDFGVSRIVAASRLMRALDVGRAFGIEIAGEELLSNGQDFSVGEANHAEHTSAYDISRRLDIHAPRTVGTWMDYSMVQADGEMSPSREA